MKKFRVIGIILLSMVCVLTLLSGISRSAGIQATGHDLSADSGNPFSYDTAQVCVFCHTPHSANSDVRTSTFANTSTGAITVGSGTPILLWNRALPQNATSYSTYTSSTMDSSTTEIRVYSLLCLSCHDGVGAMNVLHNYPNDGVLEGGDPAVGLQDPLNNNPFPLPVDDHDQMGDVWDGTDPVVGFGINIGEGIPASGNQPVELGNDHPISFDYSSTLVTKDAGLESPNAGGWVSADKLPLYPNLSGDPVSLECSTCHDVHNEGDLNQGTYPFLRASINESQLCLDCHKK